MRELLVIVCSLAVIAAVEGTRQLWRWSQERRRAELQRRLQNIGHDSRDEGALLRSRKLATSPTVHEVLRKFPLANRMDALLEQADSRFTVAQIFSWSLLSAGGVFLLAFFLKLGPALSAVLAALALLAPTLAMLVARDRRSRRVSEQLPEALDMMSRSLRAGHALSSSLEVVAREMPEPVAVEFGRVFESQRLGLPLDQAIVQMTARLPRNGDVKIFAVSTLIQKETGGNLAEILSNLSETIRARYRFYGKLRALTAEGRASAVVVAAMPLIVVVVLRAVNPTFMMPLFTEPMGRMFLAFAVTSWALGIVWLYRMSRVDF
jgi:tight adherence protein B